ncbi:hypothetical protein BDZ97DRAFT_1925137 [Flammula alnicola]|nr:hypothetical protein BDZ97DRAFT_1925137 [Flammula alnicola]
MFYLIVSLPTPNCHPSASVGAANVQAIHQPKRRSTRMPKRIVVPPMRTAKLLSLIPKCRTPIRMPLQLTLITVTTTLLQSSTISTRPPSTSSTPLTTPKLRSHEWWARPPERSARSRFGWNQSQQAAQAAATALCLPMLFSVTLQPPSFNHHASTAVGHHNTAAAHDTSWNNKPETSHSREQAAASHHRANQSKATVPQHHRR